MGTKRKQTDINGDERTNQHSASVIRSTRDEKPVHYTLKIQSFSLLKDVLASSKREIYESQNFDAGGYKCIRDKYLTIQDGKMRRFSAIKTEWGFQKLVSLETFNDPSNGLLVDDCCVFGVDIFVMKCYGKGEVFSFIKQPKNYKYTWKINKFSQLSYAPLVISPILLQWRTTVGVFGCILKEAPKRSLAFYPCTCILIVSKSFPKVLKCTLILSQLKVEPKIKVTCKCWFGIGGVESGGWGSPDFLSLSDLKDPTKGFIVDDTIIVEVKINLISTLKKIL